MKSLIAASMKNGFSHETYTYVQSETASFVILK